MSKQALRWNLIVPVLFSAAVLAPARAPAEGAQLNAQVDLEYIHSMTERENEDESSPAFGEETDTEFSWLKQRYKLELRKELYPFLHFLGGGYLELIDSRTETNGRETDFDERTDRVFGEIDLDNPLYRVSGAYRRRNFEVDREDFAVEQLTRDEYSALWHWRPVGFPSLDLDFSRFHTWDNQDLRDLINSLLVVKSRYNYEDFASDYTYTRSNRDEQILQNGSLTQVHNGGLRYPKSFLDDRLEITGSARFNYETLEPQEAADVLLPTASPGVVFFLQDDSDPGSQVPAVNIGRNGPTTDVAAGLDFSAPTEVDTIHVLPREDASDPDLASPAEIAAIAGSFLWTAWTSDDGLSWTQQAVLSQTYDVFENRFEIVFARVDTLYIKVVTAPLTTATKEIWLENVRGFTTVPGEPGLELETFTHTYNLGLEWAATDKTTSNFDSLLRIRRDDPFEQKKTTLTNSLGVDHEFTPVFSGNLRVLRTDTIDTERTDSVRHNYTAALIGDYFPSLNQRLVYSGTHDKEGDRSGYSNSILLRTNADVYRDWGVNLDLGYATRNPIRGAETSSASLRLVTNIIPNRRLNFTIDYLGSYDREEDRPSGFSHIARFQGFWVPIDTLSLSAVVGLRDKQRDGVGLRTTHNYAANWAPFPDGQLRFTLAYNQTIDTNDVETKTLTPQINWQLTRATLLTVSFDYGTIESDIETSQLRVLRARFRTFY